MKDDDGLNESFFLEALVDTTDAIFTAVREDGTLVWVNSAFSRVTGFSKEEAVGRKIWEFRCPVDLEEGERHFQQASSARDGRRFESRWLTRDGRTLDLSWSTRSLPNPDGSLHLRIGTAIDVTAERQTERRAKYLDDLLDRSMDAIILISAERNIIYCNRSACDLYRMGRDEMLGKPNEMFIPESEAERMMKFGAEIRKDRKPVEIETWRRRGDGVLVPIHLRVTPLIDEDGSISAFASVSFDISDRLALEERERQAMSRARLLADLVESLSDPVFHIRTDGTIGYVNSACAQVYGYTPEEMLDKSSSMLRPDDKVALVSKYVREVLASSDPLVLETEALHKDGTRIPVELRSKSLRDQNGELLGLGSVVRDLTMQKELEAELRRAADTDALTGLANRHHFGRVADVEVRRAARYRHGLAVIACDIDHFKGVNDTYGHAGGDRALVAFAQAASACMRRPIDLLGRVGGEEFAVLLPETDLSGAVRVAERIRAAIERVQVNHDGQEFGLTVSLGVSLFRDGETSLEAALKRADDALYLAKNKGRNRVESARE
ncbi:MAG: PAS domain S-box protein [Minwuia sp.]|nr:PAS domain S-box protein [Minwuia sp.]